MSLIMKLQQLQGESLIQLQNLYHSMQFPMEIRYYCAQWIEAQQWSSIDVENPMSEPAAGQLLQELLDQIGLKAEDLTGDEMFPIRLKLSETAREFQMRYSSMPLNFVRLICHVLEAEQKLVDQGGSTDFDEMPVPDSHREIKAWFDQLNWLTQDTAKDLNNLQQKQEMINVQYQEMTRIQGRMTMIQSMQNYQNKQQELTNLQQKKVEFESTLQIEAQEVLQKRMELAQKHQQTFELLGQVQHRVLEDELIRWKRQQQLAGIGGPPEGNLDTLQSWCEELAEIIWQNRQQIKRVELLRQQLPINMHSLDLLPELDNKITTLLSTLVTSTFIIEKQPPQVLKKETRFSASVRLLVGGKLNVHMTPPQVKATIISESQAKALLKNESANMNETSGDILNNCGVMEYHKDTGVLNVTFRNMSLKRIRRADRRGSEFVTEEKFTVLFQSQFKVSSGELVFHVRTLSLPVVVVSHGNQECNALATILWDNAFSEAGRIPFVVPDKVLWPAMAKALNSKFMAANGRSLSNDNLQYLAAKAFSSQSINTDDFTSLQITWSNFNRDPMPNRTFTFWRWFHGVMELTRKHFRGPWNDGSIMGFVSRHQAQELLMTKPVGTFLLRFSDSEIGGITIAWVGENDRGERVVLNLQPYTGDDFNIRSLADRIKDLGQLVYLYPDIPKHVAFHTYYSNIEQTAAAKDEGYVPASIKATIPTIPGEGIHMTMSDQPFSPPSQNSDDLGQGAADVIREVSSVDNTMDEADISQMLDEYDEGPGLNLDSILSGIPIANVPSNST
ncbi:signal transducer and activator of transcription 5A-like isoform X2 [Apostichopus japonicus]